MELKKAPLPRRSVLPDFLKTPTFLAFLCCFSLLDLGMAEGVSIFNPSEMDKRIYNIHLGNPVPKKYKKNTL